MESCLVCGNLVLQPGPSGGFIRGGRGIDLANSASNCRLCSIVWEGLSTFCVRNTEEVEWFALKQDNNHLCLRYKHPAEVKVWIGLEFYTDDAESPLSDIFNPSEDFELDTACDKYLAQAKGWVRECCESHAYCKERLSTLLPTRVLDVAHHEDFVFLCEPEETQMGSYVALSHVWGGQVPIRTTTDTLGLFKCGIRLDSLPQTFRDAVSVTRLLECRYLWIDSLCIIQDCKEDWEWQATRMADVYGNAYVTIAAVKSANSNDGLFSKHETAALKHTVRRLDESGRDVIINVRPAIEHSPYYCNDPHGLHPGTEASLLKRAWCFQEYLLSPRVLLFTELEILWVCLTRTHCNCKQNSQDPGNLVFEGELRIGLDRSLRSESPPALATAWALIVDYYALKDLTYATDKLAALAGIASLFAGKHFGRYINGLWEPSLVRDLFWAVDTPTGTQFNIVGHRLEDSSMPSWSWTSVVGPVSLNRAEKIEGLELVDIPWEPNKLGSLVDISAKSLTLRGFLINARIWTGWLEMDHVTEAQMWTMDVPAEVTCGPDKPIHAHILCGTEGGGLVIVLVQGSNNKFRRLGRNWYLPPGRSHYPTRTIQLV
ncbi:HET-domain-containing protein [Nemania abortiva]|nr:HET-domain-containing protein [Nemania abortiva]